MQTFRSSVARRAVAALTLLPFVAPALLAGADFGLGFAVVDDVGRGGGYGSVGRYSWGGIYGSAFWVDPKEEMVGVMMIQLYPPTGVRIGQTFQTLAYQAIVGPPRVTNGDRPTARR